MTRNQLEIRSLGELEVAHGGRAVALPASKKTRALLGYLVAAPRPHLREELCELLWPGPNDPRAALRWSLTKLRGLVDIGGETRIVADRNHIAFEPRGMKLDVAEVRESLVGGVTNSSVDTLRAAAARFRGEFLAGLDLPDCYRYHQFCVAERESTRALRIAILASLADRLEDPAEALVHARARVAADPLSEAAHVRVVEILASLGRKSEALEAYDTCRKILLDELRAVPSRALIAARARIGQTPTVHETTTPAPVTTPPSAGVASVSASPAGLHIVGRATELSAAIDFVGRATEPGVARVLLLTGEPGIGKSTMLEAMAQYVRANGGTVLSGRAFEVEMVRPYGAWIDAVRSCRTLEIPDGVRNDLATLLPELGAPPDHGDRGRLFDAVVRLLAHGALKAPLIVTMDDIQWFDEASAALLHYVARADGMHGVVVACGARPDEIAENPAAQRAIGALKRERRLHEIALGPLSRADLASLVDPLGDGVDLARVAQASNGNPLFAIEVARALARGDAPLCDSLSQLLLDRLGRLPGSGRELVMWAATVGRAFDLDLLERATRMPPVDLLAGIEDLERRGVLRTVSSGYDFVHDLVRAAAYRSLSDPRRRLSHLQIARALDVERDPSLAGEVAHHAALGGDSAMAVQSYLLAAERSLRVFAGDEAARLAESGLGHVERLADRAHRARMRLALLKVHVFSGVWQNRAEQLGERLRQAVREAESTGLNAEAAAGFHTLSILQHDGGDFGGARDSTFRAANAGLAADRDTAARQLAQSARCLVQLERDMSQASDMIARAKEAYANRYEEGLPYLEWAQALMSIYLGSYGEARTLLERVLSRARAQEDGWAQCEALTRVVLSYLHERRAQEAIATCADLHVVASKLGDGSQRSMAEALEALARAMHGAEDSARLEGAIDLLRKADAKGMFAIVCTFAAELDISAGRLSSARTRAAAALAAAEVVDRRSLVALARVALAEVALREGNVAVARREIEATFRDHVAPLGLSARARAAVTETAARVGVQIPTIDTTLATTNTRDPDGTRKEKQPWHS